MRYYELEVQHLYKNKFVSRHRVSARKKMSIIGSNRTADIRILGDDVGGVHAYIEFHNGKWLISDAGSTFGTWLNKKPISTLSFTEETTVVMGGHQFCLKPHEYDREIFTQGSTERNETRGEIDYHQIVVKRGGYVVRTYTIDSNAPFTFHLAGQGHTLACPKKGEVKKTNIGSFEVIQRLVQADEHNVSPKDYLVGWTRPDMRAPIMAALMILVLLTAVVISIPQKPEESLEEIKKSENKYTKLVFDAELMKKKKAEAQLMRKTIMAKTPEPAAAKNPLTTPVKSKGTTPKVVSKIKIEGLSAMLGKIAKRANQNGPQIAAFGKAADSHNTSGVTTVAAVGSIQGSGKGPAGNGGETYKVGGVGTLGKGGGNGRNVAGIGALATGGAGTGTVGILDEETEIDGGLDKEVIARIIASNIGQIRYCYERELSARPELYGKVQVKFTINAEGVVQEQRVGTSTLSSAMVEGCILRRLATWKFPKPRGGTNVLVTYPFMFKSTN